MRSIPAGSFKQHCLRLLDEVGASGESIVITKRGRPVAELTPVRAERRDDWRGVLADCGEIRSDLVAPAADLDEWSAIRE